MQTAELVRNLSRSWIQETDTEELGFTRPLDSVDEQRTVTISRSKNTVEGSSTNDWNCVTVSAYTCGSSTCSPCTTYCGTLGTKGVCGC